MKQVDGGGGEADGRFDSNGGSNGNRVSVRSDDG